eukprot:4428754-Amphidinium_carterae.1
MPHIALLSPPNSCKREDERVHSFLGVWPRMTKLHISFLATQFCDKIHDLGDLVSGKILQNNKLKLHSGIASPIIQGTSLRVHISSSSQVRMSTLMRLLATYTAALLTQPCHPRSPTCLTPKVAHYQQRTFNTLQH